MEFLQDDWTCHLFLLGLLWVMAPVFWWMATNEDENDIEQ